VARVALVDQGHLFGEVLVVHVIAPDLGVRIDLRIGGAGGGKGGEQDEQGGQGAHS
jgi:hypothetical protein